MWYSVIRRVLSRLALALIFLTAAAAGAVAADDPEYVAVLDGGTAGSLVPGNSITVTDNNGAASFTNLSIKNYISLKVKEENLPLVSYSFSATVTYDLEYRTIAQPGQWQSENGKSLVVSYDPVTSKPYDAEQYYSFSGALEVRVNVVSINIPDHAGAVAYLLLSNRMQCSRDYAFDCGQFPDISEDLAPVLNDLASWQTPDEIGVVWATPSITNGTEIDIEWAWVNTSDQLVADRYQTGGVFDPALIFTDNASRVTVPAAYINATNPSLKIPLLYESGGTIFVRARFAQLNKDGARLTGIWNTSGTSLPPDARWQYGFFADQADYKNNGHMPEMNWQATTSYAEDGKRKTVISYFDGSLRNRQTVTKDNTSETPTTVVAETMYDYQGRPVIQVLPAPTISNLLEYTHRFNVFDKNGVADVTTYPKEIYDILAADEQVCTKPSTPLYAGLAETGHGAGAANYYSSANPMLNDPAADPSTRFIPDAGGLPYTETRFTQDGTGRVASQSGVGKTHAFGGSPGQPDRFTKYFYSQPAQSDLDGLFGTDVGDASHYFKTLVRDPNGQYSVSYTDMAGRTIATALAGQSPGGIKSLPALNSLDEADGSFRQVEKDLLEGNNVTAGSIESSSSIVLTETGDIALSYHVSRDRILSMANCGGEPVCFECKYRLEINVSDGCGNVYLPGGNTGNGPTYQSDLFTLEGLGSECGETQDPVSVDFSVGPLPEGEYIISKRLILSPAVRDYYLNNFVLQPGAAGGFVCMSLTELKDAIKDRLSEINPEDCKPDCESCASSLGIVIPAELKEDEVAVAGIIAGARQAYVTSALEAAGYSEGDGGGMIEEELGKSFDMQWETCAQLCGVGGKPDEIESIRQQMLDDMRPPNGQYARLDERVFDDDDDHVMVETDPVTGSEIPRADHTVRPFNIFNQAFGENFRLPNRAGEMYRDEAGRQDVSIHPVDYDPADGFRFYEKLASIEVPDYVSLFRPSWAEALLAYHPEYTRLQYVENNLRDAYRFKADVFKYNYNNAKEALLFTGPFSSAFLYQSILIRDLLFAGQSNSFYRDQMAQRIISMPMKDNSGQTKVVNMWRLAVHMALCPTTEPSLTGNRIDFNDCYPGIIDGATLDSYSPALCDADKEQVWEAFRSLYFTQREIVQAQMIRDRAPINGVFQTYLNIGNEYHYQERFIDPEKMSDFIRGQYPDLNDNPTNSVTEEIHRQHLSIAAAYLPRWQASLKACECFQNYTDAQIKHITDALLEICAGGIDEEHPLGSPNSSVAVQYEGVNGTVNCNSFNEVIAASLPETCGIGDNPTPTCNSYIIDMPKAYDWSVISTGKLLIKKEECICERLTELNEEKDDAGFTTLREYLTSRYHTEVSQEDLDRIAASCVDNPGCSSIVPPLLVPKILQCGNNSGGLISVSKCIDCNLMGLLIYSYSLEAFPDKNIFGPFTDPAELQSPVPPEEIARRNAANDFCAKFFNQMLGQSKSWEEYADFLRQCNTVPTSQQLQSAPPVGGNAVREGVDKTVAQQSLEPENEVGCIDVSPVTVKAASEETGSPAYNPMQGLVNSLAGNGITISNITAVPGPGPAYDAIGSFENGYQSLGLESGLVLTNGSVSNIPGPNHYQGSQGAGRDNNGPGYQALNDISNGVGSDAARVEFDFIPSSNKVNLTYVFGSEEYNEFINSPHNDVFGIFLSGPGIDGVKNIARISSVNSQIQVSVNNVNKGNANNPPVNPLFFINNTDHPDESPAFVQAAENSRLCGLEYDGLTIPLTATASVIPGETYHMVLAIQDVNDGIYDAGLFVKSGSLSSEQPCSELALIFLNLFSTFKHPSIGNSDGEIHLSDFGITYTWEDGATTPDRTDLPPGSYRVLMTTNDGCYATKTFVLVEGGKTLLLCANEEENYTLTEPDCEEQKSEAAQELAEKTYKENNKALKDDFVAAYNNECLSIQGLESFTATYSTKEYHYTLYYYDQAGNLVQTVPPAGVHPKYNDDDDFFTKVKEYREAGYPEDDPMLEPQRPDHTLATRYVYNSLNQVVQQQTPDAGLSRFWYDYLGRLVVSQNAKQAANDDYSYTLYDRLGRIAEVGQKNSANPMEQLAIAQALPDDFGESVLSQWLGLGSDYSSRTQITRTVYDEPYGGFPTNLPSSFVAKNLRNRVAYTQVWDEDDSNPLNFRAATYYNYDIHGNVEELLNDYNQEAIANVYDAAPSTLKSNRFKRIAYKYDLISGKVNEVAYQPGYADCYYHRYAYDAENRLTMVETSRDQLIWRQEAEYKYYKHGPLARTVLGEKGLQIQGIDYAYTLQGWLKGVNGTSATTNPDGFGDMGNDGAATSLVARDAYSFALHYFQDAGLGQEDYTAIGVPLDGGANNYPFAAVNAIGANFKPLYNGNIAAMSVNLPKVGEPLLYAYTYDQLNRLTNMDAFKGLDGVTNIWNPVSIQDYKEEVTYDPNGNINSYNRNGAGSVLDMDRLTYQYPKTNDGRIINNRLRYVHDEVAADKYTEDIDTQTPLALSDLGDDKQAEQTDDNYQYDEIGNLVKDNAEGITDIEWTVYGKIAKITKLNKNNSTTEIRYTYDASGNRITKTVGLIGGASNTTTYVRDASGNVMGIYELGNTSINNGALTLAELHQYGSSRLGIYNCRINMQDNTPPLTGLLTFTRGKKIFELTNHLGNVLATITDKRLQVPDASITEIDHYEADINTATDYYPFGMPMPKRAGYRSQGGVWSNGGTMINGVMRPKTLSLDYRGNNLPGEYVASHWIDFEREFTSGLEDEYIARLENENTPPTQTGETGSGSMGETGLYRYGFNGKEMDNEVSGTGSQYDYGFRIYNPRLGRFLTTDPLFKSYPELTPYQFASNSPVQAIDLDGLEAVYYYTGNPLTNGFAIAKNISGPVNEEDLNKLGYFSLAQVHKAEDIQARLKQEFQRRDDGNRMRAGVEAYNSIQYLNNPLTLLIEAHPVKGAYDAYNMYQAGSIGMAGVAAAFAFSEFSPLFKYLGKGYAAVAKTFVARYTIAETWKLNPLVRGIITEARLATKYASDGYEWMAEVNQYFKKFDFYHTADNIAVSLKTVNAEKTFSFEKIFKNIKELAALKKGGTTAQYGTEYVIKGVRLDIAVPVGYDQSKLAAVRKAAEDAGVPIQIFEH